MVAVCPFELLRLDADAQPSEVESAWRRLSRDCHPDKCPGDPEANAKFRAITDAKEVLLDPERRAAVAQARGPRAPAAKSAASRGGVPPRGSGSVGCEQRAGGARPGNQARSDHFGSSSGQTYDKVDVTVVSLSSEIVARLDLPAWTTVRDAKLQLEVACEVPIFRQRLSCRFTTRELRDKEVLRDLRKPIKWILIPQPHTPEMDQKLLEVARKGDAQAVSSALDARSDPSCVDATGSTPLSIAAQLGHEAVARKLVAAGADVNRAVANGESVVFLAATGDHANVIGLLCESRADVNRRAKNGDTPLFVGAGNGCLSVVSLLLQAGADMNAPAQQNGTPLYFAARNGHLEVVQLLSGRGADKEKGAENGETPVFIAAARNHSSVVRFLCESKADVERPTRFDDTPLKLATLQGFREIVRILRDNGARM